MSKFDPYEKAEELDAKINKMLEEHPITEENVNVWTIFQRTIQSSLTIIERRIEKIAKDAAT